MENVSTYIETKKDKYLEWFIFLLFGVLSCLIDEAYSYNPFILPIIYFSYQRGINTYLVCVVGMLFASFFISIDYGVEILLIQLVFFISNLICCLINNEFIKKYGSFYFTHILFAVLFLIRFFSFINLFNVILMIVLSASILYSYQNLIDCIYKKDQPFNQLGKVIVLATISILSFGINIIYIFVIRLVHLISIKTTPIVECLLAVLLNAFIIYNFQDSSEAMIISIVVPALIATLINKKYSPFVYFITFTLIAIYFFEDFYVNRYFYQGIISIAVSFLIPESWFNYIEGIFSRDENKMIIETNNKLQETKNAVNDIIGYLDILINTKIEDSIPPEEKMVLLIKKRVCNECLRNDKCKLNSIIRMSLERDLLKEERTLLFQECLFPYKILKNIRLKKDTLDNERHYLEEIRNKNEMYKQEIEMVYTPLRNIFTKSAILKDRKRILEETMISKKIKFNDLSIFDTTIKFKVELIKKEDINNIVNVVSNTFKKTYYVDDIFYILCLNQYEVTLSCKERLKIEQSVKTQGFNNNINGDNFISFQEEGHFYLLFSDGIGHNKQSSSLSLFLIQSLNMYRKIEPKIIKQIENANVLLKSKVNDEKYATLDYIDINLVTGKMEMFKCGSFYSFLYKQGTLIKFKSNSPPIGILPEIKTSSLIKELNNDDILIFMSDGYLDNPDRYIEEVLKVHYKDNVDIICDELHKTLMINTDINDDKTLIVLKLVNLK